MTNRILTALSVLALLLTAGCAKAQPSPSPAPVVGWTWTLGTGTTTTLYVAKVASLTSACPTPGGSTYGTVGTVSASVNGYTDAGETQGTFICALTQNSSPCNGTTCYSPYSPVSAVFSVPALPTAPGSPVPNVTTAMLAPQKREGPHAPTNALNSPSRPGAPVAKMIVLGRSPSAARL